MNCVQERWCNQLTTAYRWMFVCGPDCVSVRGLYAGWDVDCLYPCIETYTGSFVWENWLLYTGIRRDWDDRQIGQMTEIRGLMQLSLSYSFKMMSIKGERYILTDRRRLTIETKNIQRSRPRSYKEVDREKENSDWIENLPTDFWNENNYIKLCLI